MAAHQQTLRVDRFATGAEFRDFFKANYGPTIAVYRFIADDPAEVAALDADLAALGDRFVTDGVMGGSTCWSPLVGREVRARPGSPTPGGAGRRPEHALAALPTL